MITGNLGSHSSFSSLRTLCEGYSMTVLRQSESVTGAREVLVQKMSENPPRCFNQLFVLHSICTLFSPVIFV